MSLVVWGPSSEVGLSPMTHFGLTISLTNTNWRRKYSSPPPPPPLTEHSQNPEFHDVPKCVRVDVPQVFWLCYSPKKKTHLVTCSFNMNDSQLLAFTAASNTHISVSSGRSEKANAPMLANSAFSEMKLRGKHKRKLSIHIYSLTYFFSTKPAKIIPQLSFCGCMYTHILVIWGRPATANAPMLSSTSFLDMMLR